MIAVFGALVCGKSSTAGDSHTDIGSLPLDILAKGVWPLAWSCGKQPSSHGRACLHTVYASRNNIQMCQYDGIRPLVFIQT